MIIRLDCVNILVFSFIFIPLSCVIGVYNAVVRFLWFGDKMLRAGKTEVIHRMQGSCHQGSSPFQHLFQDVVVVVDLGVFLA
jgi:UPF0716 family protein affecting phage T7 exclusion